MLQTDLFFNEAKSIFIVILLIFILKGGDTIMVIIRNGKEIELTWDEVSDAHKEFVTSWMSGVAISDFDVDIYTSRHFTHLSRHSPYNFSPICSNTYSRHFSFAVLSTMFCIALTLICSSRHFCFHFYL